MTKEQFVEFIYPLAAKTEAATGLNKWLIIGMVANESGWARSEFMMSIHNLLGIGYNNKNTTLPIKYITDSQGNFSSYWVYPSHEAAFKDLARILYNVSAPGYIAARKYLNNDPERAIEELAYSYAGNAKGSEHDKNYIRNVKNAMAFAQDYAKKKGWINTAEVAHKPQDSVS